MQTDECTGEGREAQAPNIAVVAGRPDGHAEGEGSAVAAAVVDTAGVSVSAEKGVEQKDILTDIEQKHILTDIEEKDILTDMDKKKELSAIEDLIYHRLMQIVMA